MQEPISAEKLKAKIKSAKLVEVEGDHYLIRHVSPFLFFDKPEDLWDAAMKKDEAALNEKIAWVVTHPTNDSMRRVLLAGVLEPKLAPADGPGVLCVEDLMARYRIAFPLFGHIVNRSLEV